MVIKGKVENLVQEIKNLKVGFMQLLRLEKLYKREAAKMGEKVKTIDEKEFNSCDKVKAFQDKMWFLFSNGLLLYFVVKG